MRLFVAVELAEAVRDTAMAVAGELRRRLEHQLRATWVPIENMHLTVRFIGHVRDEHVPSVLSAISEPLAIEPFDLALGECGVFPPTGPPRVLWIGVREGLASLRAMHDEFDRRLLPHGFEPEQRPYSAHLTLARIKDAPAGSRSLTRSALQAIGPITARCRVSYATMFESRTSPKGARYTPLTQIPLSITASA